MCECLSKKELKADYLKPIKFKDSRRYYSFAGQANKWAKKNNWTNFQLTHNIMYNMDAIMSMGNNNIINTVIFTFKDGSWLNIAYDSIIRLGR